MPRTTLKAQEALILSAICFGLPILWSVEAVAMGFPDANFSASGTGWMIGLELVLSATALLYLRARNFDIRTLYPRPTLKGSAVGVALFFAAWLVGAIAVAPLQAGEKRQVIDFTFSGLSLASIVLFGLVNGAFEELFLLGALVNGLRGYGLSIAVGAALLVRVLFHLYQGPLGVVWILAFGMTLTVGYLVTRQLWPAVLAHSLWDIVPMLFGGS